jgi:starch synthase
MRLKLFFLTTEITPFVNATSLADFSAKVPLLLQAKDHDIRIMHPKYGFISERKFILREVIRLREIPFVFDGKDQMTSAKSAFIPRTRVQVYFLEHLDWFKPLSNLVYKSKNGRILSDNPMRYSFYGNASLATLPHLFWSPDIIICNGWQSSMVPIIYNQRYKKEKFYKGIKTVQVIDSIDECSVFSRKAYEAAGVKIPENIKGEAINTFEVSSHFSDHIIVFNTPGNNVANKLLKLNGVKENEKKLSIIDLDSTETPDYSAIANEMEIILKKLSR